MSQSNNIFSYRGRDIPTKFPLGEEQVVALQDLIDYVLSDDLEPITLSGSAGSGKTALIKYLDEFIYRYRSYGYNFLYAAPTHAATVYLGLNLGFLPYTLQSIMVNRYDDKTKKWKKAFSSKFQLNLMKQNVLIIDESSMISNTDLADLLRLSKKHILKVIFLGDKVQIPEVSVNKIKQISDVFTKLDNITLTKVHRTSNDDILKILTEIRENPDGYLPIVNNTDNLKFYSQIDKPKFYMDFLDTYIKEPEDTVFITYTNNSIKLFNNSVRKDVYGSREDLKTLFVGETIIGYGGYNNKTVSAGNLANSIRFKVEAVNKCKSFMRINAFSKIANSIDSTLGRVTTDYYQLSLEDSIIFDEITSEDMEENNKIISAIFRRVFHLKQKALRDGSWKTYFVKMNDVTKALSTIDLGNAYIYNPTSDKMELFNKFSVTHKNLRLSSPELFIDKGIDFGYAITIHKSQGSTYKNVFFDSSSTENNTTPLLANGVKVGTEGNSLNYVGMSRAKDNLFVLHGSKIKRLEQ
jgi:dda DNA helicase